MMFTQDSCKRCLNNLIYASFTSLYEKTTFFSFRIITNYIHNASAFRNRYRRFCVMNKRHEWLVWKSNTLYWQKHASVVAIKVALTHPFRKSVGLKFRWESCWVKCHVDMEVLNILLSVAVWPSYEQCHANADRSAARRNQRPWRKNYSGKYGNAQGIIIFCKFFQKRLASFFISYVL